MTEPITEPLTDQAEDPQTTASEPMNIEDADSAAVDVAEGQATDTAEADAEAEADAAPADTKAGDDIAASVASDETTDDAPVAADSAEETTEEGDTVEVEITAEAGETAESTGAAEARQAARLSREAPQPDDPDADERTTKQWYVIHTYSGYENKVKTNLEHRIESMGVEDQIYQVLVPMEEEIEIRNGQRQTVNKKVFPGYVLVEMIMTDESWYVVRNTPGVTSFVGSGNRPTALREGEVKAILKQMGVEAPKFKVQFQKGQSVRVTDGPFAEFIGTVDEVHPERNKVRVLVSIFGRETPVELDFLQIEKL
jgi:transcriptional antiterminator NusG